MKPLLTKSDVLQAEVWIVQDEEQAGALRNEGDTRPIYLRSELPHLKGLDPQMQRMIHAVKESVGGEVIETIRN